MAYAGAQQYLNRNPELKGGVFVTVTSGANVNFDRLRFITERAKIGEGKEVLLCIHIKESIGSFLKMYTSLGKFNFVTEFSYRHAHSNKATIFMALEVENQAEDSNTIISQLKGCDVVFDAMDISSNALELRYLTGGGRSNIQNELLICFKFPEVPGALKKFLVLLNIIGNWNITLFHYRNNGSDVGKVLAGFDVPRMDMIRFRKFWYCWVTITSMSQRILLLSTL